MNCLVPTTRFLILLMLLTAVGCGSGLPNAPPPMDLESEKKLMEKNAKLEIDHINADSSLSDTEKEKRINQVHRGTEGYLKTFAKSKEERDREYGTP